MVFCPNCGASVEGRFCAKCGSAVAPGGADAGGTGPVPGAQQYSAQSATGGMSENLAGALCYILGLITGILFLVLAPYNQSKFVRFHAFQAIFFHVAWIVLVIVETVVAAALPFGLLMLSSLLWLVIALGGLLVWLFLMYKAYNNERFKLPLIGDLAEKQA